MRQRGTRQRRSLVSCNQLKLLFIGPSSLAPLATASDDTGSTCCSCSMFRRHCFLAARPVAHVGAIAINVKGPGKSSAMVCRMGTPHRQQRRGRVPLPQRLGQTGERRCYRPRGVLPGLRRRHTSIRLLRPAIRCALPPISSRRRRSRSPVFLSFLPPICEPNCNRIRSRVILARLLGTLVGGVDRLARLAEIAWLL
jgi:hypothetical protein